ncbi:MAG: hypothetical protein DRN04_06235 [Thermoprotei archaeon]|nr:MAG: hypothetical protein DRN04_06235 [Thermoprotei archaeon]
MRSEEFNYLLLVPIALVVVLDIVVLILTKGFKHYTELDFPGAGIIAFALSMLATGLAVLSYKMARDEEEFSFSGGKVYTALKIIALGLLIYSALSFALVIVFCFFSF